jgi:hypothetical protein
MVDDIIFHQSLVALRRLDSHHRGISARREEKVLYKMLRTGLVDPVPSDKPFDASTRAMRYSAAVSDRLWELVRCEQSKVSPTFSPNLRG